jgi:transcriptional regulator with XRE-family HTH domain
MDSNTRTSPVDMWIGSRVRIKGTSRGMSQQELSKLLGIGRNDLAAFEAGIKRINTNLLFRIAESLTRKFPGVGERPVIHRLRDGSEALIRDVDTSA